MSPNRRELQAQERRDHLLDTALEVFAQKGFESATVKDLSGAAGVAQGLFYHYFESKETLLLAVVEKHTFLPEMRGILSASHERETDEVLPEVLGGVRALFDEKEELVRIFFREAQTNPELARRLEEMIQEGVRLLSRYLNARVETGELEPHDTEVTARSLLYAVFMAHLTDVSAEGFLPRLVRTTLYGIKEGG